MVLLNSKHDVGSNSSHRRGHFIELLKAFLKKLLKNFCEDLKRLPPVCYSRGLLMYHIPLRLELTLNKIEGRVLDIKLFIWLHIKESSSARFSVSLSVWVKHWATLKMYICDEKAPMSKSLYLLLAVGSVQVLQAAHSIVHKFIGELQNWV